MTPPSPWYFPTAIQGVVIACDYNPIEQRYNKNCREMRVEDIPQPRQAAVKRIITIFDKIGNA
ncbi:hypothetical protein IP69_05585 [Bosea sp. AAP35]|nr:hypothetical protein IP69_05585 [Bosea sp. AAP35]